MEAIGGEDRQKGAWIRRRRWWLGAAGALLVAALGIGVATAWHFSDRVLVPDHSSWARKAEVEAVRPGRIVLARDDDTERPGVYGLEWPGGHAIIGKSARLWACPLPT